MSIAIFMISKGRKQDRTWKEECPYCDYSSPDGYGTCENCGQWTTGWWEQVEKESSSKVILKMYHLVTA